jgi:PAS domain S-box-containing protein
VILDWILQDGKGDELLPENPTDLRFPVIVMTSYGDEALGVHLVQRGAVDYIAKSKAIFDDLPHIVERGLQTWKDRRAKKKLEQRLTSQESILRAVLSNPVESIVLLSRDGIILDLNTAMADALGRNAPGFIGTCIFDYFPKTLAASRQRYVREVFETGAAAHFDDERNGRWYDNIIQPVTDSTGKVIQVVVIGRDITERKQVGEALKQSEEQYRVLVENERDVVYRMDADLKFTFLNQATEQLTGYSAEEMMGRSILEILTPLSATMVRKRLAVRLEGVHPSLKGESAVFEVELRGKNGEIIQAEVSSTPIITPEGTLAGFQGITRDITERRRAEEKRRIYETRLNYAMEIGNLAWWEMDLPGGEVRFDDRKAAMLGYSPDLFHHYSDFTALLHPDDLEPTMQAMRDHLSGTLARYYTEYRIRTSDGSYRWLRDVGGITGRQADGTPATVTGIVIDITAGKRVEESLRESEERYRTLIEELPDFVIVQRQGELLYVNAAVSKLLGNSAVNVIHTSIFDYIMPESRETILTVMEKREAGGSPLPYVVKITVPDGSIRWVEIRGAGIMYEGQPATLNVLTDITENKWATEAIFASEQKFRALADYTFDWEYWIGPDEKYIYVTPSCERITGYTPEEFYHNKDFLNDLVVPEDQDIFRTHTSQAKDSADPGFLEFRIRTKQGNIVWIGHVCHPIYNSDGEYLGRRGSNRDITEKKLVDEALRESEVKYRELVSHIPIGVGIVTLDGHALAFNDAMCRIFNASPEQLKNTSSLMSYQHPDDRARLFERLEREGEIRDHELSLKRRDGTSFDANLNLVRFIFNDETVAFVMIEDISEKKMVQTALVESEERYRSLFNLSPVGIVLTNVAGNILEMNDAMLNTFGYSREEIGSMNISALHANPDTRIELAGIILCRGSISDYEIVCKRRDGSTFPALLNSSRIIRGGERLFQSSVIDITDRKLMEEEIRSLNRALEQRVIQRTNELNATLGEKEILLREIHHRVKNNLQIIISILRLQKRQITDSGTMAILQDCESRVLSMALVHEKLYRSKDLAYIDIGDYLRTLTQNLFTTYSINQKTVTFHVEITDIQLDINRAIPVGLILNELISNSLKHAFPLGHEGRIVIHGKQEKGEIVLSLQDDGIGLPVGFDWRHCPSLGMHLVMTLIEQVQGKIEMADCEKGAHFIIRIPGDQSLV